MTMEENRPAPNYRGEFPAYSDFETTRGTLWFLYQNQRRLNLVNANERDDNIAAGQQIAILRQDLGLDGYTPRFRFEAMRFKGVLGLGLHGRVWKANFKEFGTMFAVKQLARIQKTSEVWKERDFLILLKGPRIVNLVGAFFHTDPFLVMELCNAPLLAFINKLSPQNQSRFVLQLVEAVQWIHSKDIIHCSLQPGNCLITTSNNLVLSGFSSSIHLENGTDTVVSDKKRGAASYQDYECNTALSYSKASDMFSVGCVLYEIVTGRPLLRYENNEIDSEEYGLAFKIGRAQHLGFGEKPKANSVRQQLSDRVKNAGRFADVLVHLVAERDQRLTSESLADHSTILGEFEVLARNNWKLENGDDNVTNDVALEKMASPFRTFNLQDSYDYHAALIGIYFDENEQVAAAPTFRKALCSYETHVVAKALVKHDMVPDLVSALAEKDPTALGVVESLVSGYLGQVENSAGQNAETLESRDSQIGILQARALESPLAPPKSTDCVASTSEKCRELLLQKSFTKLHVATQAIKVAAEFAKQVVVNPSSFTSNNPANSTNIVATTKTPDVDPLKNSFKIPRRARDLTPPPRTSGAQPGALTARNNASSVVPVYPPTLYSITNSSLMMPPPQKPAPAKKPEFAIPSSFFKSSNSTSYDALPSAKTSLMDHKKVKNDDKTISTSSSHGSFSEQDKKTFAKPGFAKSINKIGPKSYSPASPTFQNKSKKQKVDCQVSGDEDDDKISSELTQSYRCQYCKYENDDKKSVQSHQKQCRFNPKNF